ncbi:MAG: amino acid permease [Deltaproteobacteria bacterium]|nr:amino acid permease [Deltaproteobacteria bacterium]
MAVRNSSNGAPHLLQGIGLTAAMALIVTNAVGTGVFLKARVMICNVGTPGMVLLAYAVAGLYVLAGALIYAELSTLMPRSGGAYNYIGAVYGRLWAFLYGWMETFIDGAASMAALAIVFVIFFNDLLGGTLSSGVSALLVAATLLFVTILNLASVRANGSIMAAITGLKVVLLIGIAGCAFFFGDGSWANFASNSAGGTCEGVPAGARAGFAGFGAAIIAAMWSYSGATAVIVVAEEVKDPSRTLPRALFSSALALIGLYLLVNAAYFFALPASAVASVSESSSVAGAVIARVVGAAASTLMAAGLMLSTFGALHSTVLHMARFPFAMARDKLLPAVFATVSPNSRVPTHAVMLLGICAIAFAISGTFDVLTDMIIFAVLIFDFMAVAGVFVLRRRIPVTARSYRAWGYPYLQVVYLLGIACLTLNTLFAMPGRSMAGLGLIALGLPVYAYYARGRPPTRMEDWLDGG